MFAYKIIFIYLSISFIMLFQLEIILFQKLLEIYLKHELVLVIKVEKIVSIQHRYQYQIKRSSN